MLVFGITGGVATGKSTVTRMLADLGAPTISADALAHDLLRPGTPTTLSVLRAFPDCAVPEAPDTLDRRALGRRVFADLAARRQLEALTHPAIVAALREKTDHWRSEPGVAAAAEIPLLFEVGLEYLVDRIVVVACGEITQVARLMARNGKTEAEARAVLAAQWPLAEKISRAHHVITTDAGPEDTRRQVEELWTSIRDRVGSFQDLLPRTKFDTRKAEALVALGYPAVAPVLPELLTWLQDINWPVAQSLQPLLAGIGLPLLPELRRILATNDDVWKYWVLSAIVGQSDALVSALRDDLTHLAKAPTDGEKKEEIDVMAHDILHGSRTQKDSPMTPRQRIEPGPGQESVWDYPRPPRLEDSPRHIQIVFNGVTLADTRRAKRVLETSHPPVYYVPPEDIQMQYLSPAGGSSFCEWKGMASYYTVSVGGQTAESAGWYYTDPVPGFAALKNYVAFYPGRMEACFVDSERVQPQPGDFYGGWITQGIVGPFKGAPGTWGW